MKFSTTLRTEVHLTKEETCPSFKDFLQRTLLPHVVFTENHDDVFVSLTEFTYQETTYHSIGAATVFSWTPDTTASTSTSYPTDVLPSPSLDPSSQVPPPPVVHHVVHHPVSSPVYPSSSSTPSFSSRDFGASSLLLHSLSSSSSSSLQHLTHRSFQDHWTKSTLQNLRSWVDQLSDKKT
ncbi:hypothetical protein HMI56_005004 [Coelomomyces lativittatus]|nr:hypothetical protein HMI56_005004 [Coelomomyces lativittatus]